MSAQPGRASRRSPRGRQVPAVFRLAGALLFIALVAGQVWQHQPAGPFTRTLLATVARHCPSAAVRNQHPTIANGAVALDRATIRLLADRFGLRPAPAFGWVGCR